MTTKTPRKAAPATRAIAGPGVATARRGVLLVLLLWVVAAVALAAPAAEPERILVLNVHLDQSRRA